MDENTGQDGSDSAEFDAVVYGHESIAIPVPDDYQNVPVGTYESIAIPVAIEADSLWMADNIIPFTKEHERMLTEVHAILTEAKTTITALAPMLTPMLGSMGITI